MEQKAGKAVGTLSDLYQRAGKHIVTVSAALEPAWRQVAGERFQAAQAVEPEICPREYYKAYRKATRKATRKAFAEILGETVDSWRAVLAKAERLANKDGQVVIVPDDGEGISPVLDVEAVPVKPKRKRTKKN
jgi:hypothetical protein